MDEASNLSRIDITVQTIETHRLALIIPKAVDHQFEPCLTLNPAMPPGTETRVFRFGPFELDEATGELRKFGIRIKLHAQPVQVLIMLLERPGELVTREDMRQRLWGDDTIVDFDHGLNTAVNKLRDSLGDSAAQPRHVETISGRGYRFISPVTVSVPVSKPVAASEVEGAAVEAAVPDDAVETPPLQLLTAPQDLPAASRNLVRTLLLLTQAMYLAFYLGALANIPEITEIFTEARLLSAAILTTLLVITAVVLIPVRLYLSAAVAFDFAHLQAKFSQLFPALLVMDLLWALSPFLLVHHISGGLALGMTAALVYMPFAQRSLVLMYTRDQQPR
jgi:cholera toxin transcriptional activator